MRLINLNSLETYRKKVTASGTPQVLSPQYVTTTLTFTNNGSTPARDTITDSASQFLVQGFRAGDKIDITGSTSNNLQFEIYSVTASTITVTAIGKMTDETASTSTTIDRTHGREVPDGVGVVIRALPTNTGTITLAPTSARALNTNTSVYDSHFRLTADESVTLNIKNLKNVWMDATVSGEGVMIGFEY